MTDEIPEEMMADIRSAFEGPGLKRLGKMFERQDGRGRLRGKEELLNLCEVFDDEQVGYTNRQRWLISLSGVTVAVLGIDMLVGLMIALQRGETYHLNTVTALLFCTMLGFLLSFGVESFMDWVSLRGYIIWHSWHEREHRSLKRRWFRMRGKLHRRWGSWKRFERYRGY